jgi:ABC-2 type transport system ATP-binding protein
MIDTHTIVIKAWNLTQKTIMEMKAKYEDVQISDGTMTITDRLADFRKIVDYLHAAGTIIRSAYIREPTLDDVFIKITGKELRE